MNEKQTLPLRSIKIAVECQLGHANDTVHRCPRLSEFVPAN